MKRSVALAATLALAMARCHHHESSPPGYAMEFKDVEHFAKEFDDPHRDEWQHPDEVIAALGLKEDSVVLDLGSGTGYFTVRIARKVEHGRVYGADVEPRMTEYLAARAKNEGLANVRAVTIPPSGAKNAEPVDAVLVVDTYHHMDDRVAYFQVLKSSLKPNAIVAIVDFKLDSPKGPPIEHRVTPEAIGAELAGAGYAEVSRLDLPYQYVIVFRVAPAK